ncbi:DUF1758 domain-containing protein [Trichonephila clavipes]|uniref:DUF1758 domain-containing protein n=1 Tax=Trichonephila clavipes TaxID=2585209 RepID=A0A8X6RAN1_TRICX|nr:DUF1758 domain-containing protein [Trichonephila clavipes]
METIPNHTDSCSKARRRSPKGYNPRERSIYYYVAKRNRRVTSTRVTSWLQRPLPDDKRIRIWRKQGTRNQPQNITEHHAFQGGSIMVRAGISLGYHTDLHIFKQGSVTAVRYRDEVLEPIVRLYAATVNPTFVLMDDNARPHRADIVDDYLENEGMAWLAYSSDLNPIENLWDALGRAVSSRFPPPATLIELETALQEEWRLLNSAMDDHLIKSMLDIEDINQRIETTEVGLKLLMYSLKNSENVNIHLNDNGKNSIRLPQIPLPEFSGVIAEFSNFKNQFINLISNNEHLNDSQKLYYLRASLKGEAKLLESPSDSFDSLFKALEDRYENKRQLIDSHVLEIINYEKIYSESAKELHALMDCINRNIRALKVLKYEQNDLSDIILINIILQKIDKESRKQFELSLKTAEVPTFDSIMKFLEKRSAVLENITRTPSTKMIHKNTAMSTKAKSLVVNSKKITVKPCILCRNSHPLYKCIAFQNMSVECRKKFVTNNKLCINCLRLHYGACMSKYKCTVSGCKGLHNSLLHDSAELCSAVKNHTVGERGIESNSNPTRFEGQPEVAVLTYGNKCVLLNTFMIFVKSADGYRIKLRGLLDNASTICVMREDIARKLGFKFKSANQSITGINGITQSSKYSANIEVSNRDYTFARNVQFSLLPKITDAIPVSKLNISDLNIPASIELADYNFHMPGQIDILIGSELFLKF